MFTDIPLKEIRQIKNENINDLKILLANEATSMLYGKEDQKNVMNKQKKYSLINHLMKVYLLFKININEIKKKIYLI